MPPMFKPRDLILGLSRSRYGEDEGQRIDCLSLQMSQGACLSWAFLSQHTLVWHRNIKSERARESCVMLGQSLPLSGLWFAQRSNDGIGQMNSEGAGNTSILWKATGNRQ